MNTPYLPRGGRLPRTKDGRDFGLQPLPNGDRLIDAQGPLSVDKLAVLRKQKDGTFTVESDHPQVKSAVGHNGNENTCIEKVAEAISGTLPYSTGS